jgi:hypothetical protein
MESAVRELYNSDNGGVLVWFLELLWRAKPRPTEHYTYAGYMPAVPDTVLLNFSRIQQWYFTPRHRHIGGGRGGPAAAGAHGAAAAASGTQAPPLSVATPANGTFASTAGAAAAVGDSDRDGALPNSNSFRRESLSPNKAHAPSSMSPRTGSPAGGPHECTTAAPEAETHPLDGLQHGQRRTAEAVANALRKKRPANLTGRAIFSHFCGRALPEPGDLGAEGKEGDSTGPARRSSPPQSPGLSPRQTDHDIVAVLICRSATAVTHSMITPGASGSSASGAASPGALTADSRRASSAGLLTRAGTTATAGTGGGGGGGGGALLEVAGPSVPRVEYYNAQALKQLLFHGSLGETALLQHFTIPKAAATSRATGHAHNETLQVHWQWSSCVVVRHRNVNRLHDGTKTEADRGATFEGARNTYSSMTGTASVAEAVKLACNAIAEHVHAVCDGRIVRMSAIFRTDGKGGVVLLFVQSVHCATKEALFRAPAVACPDKLVSPLLFTGRHMTLEESRRLDASRQQPSSFASATLDASNQRHHHNSGHSSNNRETSRADRVRELAAQRDDAIAADLRVHGCNSVYYREPGAHEKYDQLIPISWRREHERRAERRTALIGRGPLRYRRPEGGCDHDTTTAGSFASSSVGSFNATRATSNNHTAGASSPRTGANRVVFIETDDAFGGNGDGGIDAYPSNSNSMAGRAQSLTAPAPSAQPLHHTTSIAQPQSPRSRSQANRRAMAQLQAKLGVVGEVVDDARWSTVSRADAALLRRDSSGIPYCKNTLAADAGRMGLGDTYITCMPAYSVGKYHEEVNGRPMSILKQRRAASALAQRRR